MDDQFDELSKSLAKRSLRRRALAKLGLDLFTLAIIVGLTALRANAQSYTITDLGTLGGPSSGATSINNNGQVVGNADTKQTYWGQNWDGQRIKYYYYNAFLWIPKTPGATIGSIQALKTAKGTNSRASSINSGAQIVGFGSGGAQLWNPDGTVTVLPGLPGSPGNDALGINDSGEIAGFANTAVIWQRGVATDLGIPSSVGHAINSVGQVAGSAVTDYSGWFRAILWTPAQPNGTTGAWVALDQSGGYGQSMGLNSATTAHPVQVVGFTGTPDDPTYAFVWDSVHGMQVIGPGSANGINSEGQIVGSTGDAFRGSGRAFIWQNGVLKDLNTLISSSSGWTLISGNGINDRSQIVGVGLNPKGAYHAFLLTPK